MLSVVKERKLKALKERGGEIYYTYRLLKDEWGIYTLVCHNETSGEMEVYPGAAEEEARAVYIFNILVDGLVAPEHLVCIVDEIIEDISNERTV